MNPKPKHRLKTILTIAGSDSCGGAGIQADIRAASLCRVYAMSVVTAVTAQSTSGIRRVVPLSADDVTEQLKAVADDQIPDAVKIGMTGSPANASAIASFIRDVFPGIAVIIDPVISSTSGRNLSGDTTALRDIYLNEIFPLATVITPNIKEAALFLNKEIHVGDTDSQKRFAAELLDKTGSRGVALKGGHADYGMSADVLAFRDDDGTVRWSVNESPRLDCPNLHGTGCAFSTFLAAGTADGLRMEEAFIRASRLMGKTIGESMAYSFGKSDNGPLNFFDYKLSEI